MNEPIQKALKIMEALRVEVNENFRVFGYSASRTILQKIDRAMDLIRNELLP